MRQTAKWIMRHRKTVLFLTIALCAFNLLSSSWTMVSTDISDFLPAQTPSTIAMRALNKEFDESSIANIDIMITDVSLLEAVRYKGELEAIEGLQSVTFLDDSQDLSQPLGYIGKDAVESWYKDRNARFTAYIDVMSADAGGILRQAREVVGDKGCIGGSGAKSIESGENLTSDILGIFSIALPLILAILLLTTCSWIEPLLFFASIGVTIFINQGTNFPMGTISSITATCSMILQLAVSMDYAIFLLDTYSEYLEQGMTVTQAMEKAIVKAFSAITASAVTTIIGFLALTIMQFRLGYDLGMVLAKGVLVSLLCTLTVLPVLSSYAAGLIEKTKHRALTPSMKKAGRVVAAVCIPVMLVIFAVSVPAYMSQSHISFLYGESAEKTGGALSEAQIANGKIKAVFKNENAGNTLVLMVPRGRMGAERQLFLEIQDIDHITSVTSYLNIADESIPPEFVGQENISLLISENYSRMILQTDVKGESPEAFALVETIRDSAEHYFSSEWLLAGNSATYYDLRATILADDKLVNLVCMAAIALTIMFTFRSLALPFILVGTIEASIWINLSRMYFAGNQLMYMSQLIINAVQLGATVDYAILSATHYVDNRKRCGRFMSAANTFAETAQSVITSAAILTIAGLLLGQRASDAYVSQIGELIGVGAMISGVCVLLALPGLLIVFDPLIRFLSLGMRFSTKKSRARRLKEENQ